MFTDYLKNSLLGIKMKISEIYSHSNKNIILDEETKLNTKNKLLSHLN